MFKLTSEHVSKALDNCGLEAAHGESDFSSWRESDRAHFCVCLWAEVRDELSSDEFLDFAHDEAFPETINPILERLAVDQTLGNHVDDMGEESRFSE